MSIMGSLILFFVFIVIYSVIIEIFTVIFRLTGVTKEKARTQVISLLTNCGFTTLESDIMLASKRRRRLAQITMLCGYSFSVTIVSVLVNLFLALNQSEIKSLIAPMLGVIAFAFIVIMVMRLKHIRTTFDSMIEKIGNRIMFGKESNILVLIDMYKNKAMVEAVLDNIPIFLKNVRLADTHLKEDYEIQILLIKRNGETLEAINGDTLIRKGDALLLFGDYKMIRSVFEHPNQ